MSREYRVMTALQDTAVPVPMTYAMCQDGSVIGAPFYVMERRVGTPYRKAAELEPPLGAGRTRAVSTRLVHTLAALHQVDPAAVDKNALAKSELARQAKRRLAGPVDLPEAGE